MNSHPLKVGTKIGEVIQNTTFFAKFYQFKEPFCIITYNFNIWLL